STLLTLRILAPVLGFNDAQVESLLAQRAARPGEPLLLSRALTFDQLSWIEEHRAELPELSLDPVPVRHYPYGEAVAHLIGYVGEITREERQDSTAWAGYRMGQHVGRSGIERQYESILGGRLGERYIEVDARGR